MANNSETFYKAKKAFNSFFSNIEVHSANAAMKIRLNRQVNWLLKGAEPISSSYKKEIRSFWRPYKKISTKYHQFYSSKNKIYDVKYVPSDLYYTVIDQHFNNRKYGWGVNDKNYYSLYFPHVKQPKVVIRKINDILYDANYHIISNKKTLKLCDENEKLIIKPATESGGGRGIVFWNQNDGIEKLKETLKEGTNLIVQHIIQQHKSLAAVHSNSVNTIRVMSLIINNEVNIFSSVLRMGVDGNKVDNASMGGITCGILETGRLKSIAYSLNGDKYEYHPQGSNFSSHIIPNYDKVKRLVKTCHERMGHFRLVSWDIAIDQNGEPVLIEANLRNGGCVSHQFNNGPLFGNLTSQVLEEVFEGKN